MLKERPARSSPPGPSPSHLRSVETVRLQPRKEMARDRRKETDGRRWDANVLPVLSIFQIYPSLNYDYWSKNLPEIIFPFGPCHWNDGSISSKFRSRWVTHSMCGLLWWSITYTFTENTMLKCSSNILCVFRSTMP